LPPELVIRRPKIELVVRETGWAPWYSTFERWHYLRARQMPFSTAYTGFVDDKMVCFIGVSAMVAGKQRCARVCRFVTLPEWQGSGVSIPFLDWIAERELRGEGFVGSPVPTYMHSNHPGLCFVLRRSSKWRQVSTQLHGSSRGVDTEKSWGWGRHFRGVQGFKYYGQAGIDALQTQTEGK